MSDDLPPPKVSKKPTQEVLLTFFKWYRNTLSSVYFAFLIAVLIWVSSGLNYLVKVLQSFWDVVLLLDDSQYKKGNGQYCIIFEIGIDKYIKTIMVWDFARILNQSCVSLVWWVCFRCREFSNLNSEMYLTKVLPKQILHLLQIPIHCPTIKHRYIF